jgi:hypothetical protein
MRMRAFHRLAALAALAAGASTLDGSPAGAVCSVFDRHPCAPTVCSVFRRRPCIPDIFYPFGQDLRLTIYSAAPEEGAESAEMDKSVDRNEPADSQHELDTVRAMFDALRACWLPPDEYDARAGMQMTVRFAFKRNGEIIATPRVTYATPGVSPQTRDIYHNAITAALQRCTPLQFSSGLAGAIAGRPVAIRFVDNRTLQGQTDDPH